MALKWDPNFCLGSILLSPDVHWSWTSPSKHSLTSPSLSLIGFPLHLIVRNSQVRTRNKACWSLVRDLLGVRFRISLAQGRKKERIVDMISVNNMRRRWIRHLYLWKEILTLWYQLPIKISNNPSLSRTFFPSINQSQTLLSSKAVNNPHFKKSS